jgi:hypothetical protein
MYETLISLDSGWYWRNLFAFLYYVFQHYPDAHIDVPAIALIRAQHREYVAALVDLFSIADRYLKGDDVRRFAAQFADDRVWDHSDHLLRRLWNLECAFFGAAEIPSFEDRIARVRAAEMP